MANLPNKGLGGKFEIVPIKGYKPNISISGGKTNIGLSGIEEKTPEDAEISDLKKSGMKLDIEKSVLAVKKAKKEMESGSGNIMQSAPLMLDIANQAADHLEKRSMMGPIGGRLSSLGKAIGGVPFGVMTQTDIINKGLGESATKLLQYMAAAGLAGQQGRGLSDADLRIAGAMAPNFDSEPTPLVKAKIAVLGKAAKGKLTSGEIRDILNGKYEDVIKSYFSGSEIKQSKPNNDPSPIVPNRNSTPDLRGKVKVIRVEDGGEGYIPANQLAAALKSKEYVLPRRIK